MITVIVPMNEDYAFIKWDLTGDENMKFNNKSEAINYLEGFGLSSSEIAEFRFIECEN